VKISIDLATDIPLCADLLWGAELSVERLRVTAAKLVQSLPEQKRDGRSVSLRLTAHSCASCSPHRLIQISWSLSRALTHSLELSTNVANSVLSVRIRNRAAARSLTILSLQSLETIPKLAERLGAADASTSDAEAVVRELDEIRSVLFRPERMRVSVTGDVLGLKRPRSDWVDNLLREKNWQPVQTEPVPWSSQVLTALGKEPAKKVKADGTLKMQLMLTPARRVSSARCPRSRARTRSSRPRASAVLSNPTRPRSL